MIILIRHLPTEDNLKGYLVGRRDVSIVQESISLSDHVKNIADSSQPLIFCSPLARARQTADLLFHSFQIDDRLIEFDFGYLEGMTHNEVASNPDYIMWKSNLLEVSLGETGADFVARVYQFYKYITSSGKKTDICVVSHGGVLRCLRAFLTGNEVSTSNQDWHIYHGEIVLFSGDSQEGRFNEFNRISAFG